LLLEEEPEHAGRRQPTCQRGGLVGRARRPQAVQQEGNDTQSRSEHRKIIRNLSPNTAI
jgi:hypothetical protein